MPGFFRASLYVLALMLVAALGGTALFIAASVSAVLVPILAFLMLPTALAGIRSWWS